uniref:Uncharacterized protein n=1 Tax=Rhizophora mucronata TaxID=61149 RepID=A0A2P2R544_RHIMU
MGVWLCIQYLLRLLFVGFIFS